MHLFITVWKWSCVVVQCHNWRWWRLPTTFWPSFWWPNKTKHSEKLHVWVTESEAGPCRVYWCWRKCTDQTTVPQMWYCHDLWSWSSQRWFSAACLHKPIFHKTKLASKTVVIHILSIHYCDDKSGESETCQTAHSLNFTWSSDPTALILWSRTF